MDDNNEEKSLIDKRFNEFLKVKDQQKLLAPELQMFAPLFFEYVRARHEDFRRGREKNAQSPSFVDGISSKIEPGFVKGTVFGNLKEDLPSEPRKNSQSTFSVDGISSKIVQSTPSVDAISSIIKPGFVNGIIFGSFNDDLTCEPRKYVQPTASVDGVSSNIDLDSIIFGHVDIARIMKLQKETKKAEELIDEEKRENSNI